MNLAEHMGWVTGLLQFIVAGYALRLNRIFGTARVGWSLFWAFSLLAALHCMQVLSSLNSGAPLGVETEAIYSLISMLLLTSMVHIETLLRERLRVEQAEERLRNGLEFLVKEKTAHLSQAIADLQSEITERERMEAEVRQSHQDLLAASHQAGKAEIAGSVLANVGNALNSVKASIALVSDQMQQSPMTNVVHISNLIRERETNWDDFLAHDPEGQKLPAYLTQLAEHLAQKQATLKTELDVIRSNLEHIKTMVETEQDRTQPAGESDANRAEAFLGSAIHYN
jgi:hypothetical protein